MPVKQRFRGQRCADCGQARAVAENLTQGNVLLAGLGELRPDIRQCIIQINAAGLHLLQQGDGAQRLGAGKHVDQRILLPDLAVVLVHHPVPEIQHSIAADCDAERRTTRLGIALLLGKELADCFKAGVEVALYLGHLVIFPEYS